MRAAIWTVVANVVLTVAIVTPLWRSGVQGSHAGIALATALAGILNAWLLWRVLRSSGLYRPQSGWGRFGLNLFVACAVMAAVVLATRGWVGEWTAINGAVARVGWLLLAIAAGAASYGLALVALGLRPRHLRH